MSLNIECPNCGATLTYNSDQSICSCEYCKITYTIEDGKLKKSEEKIPKPSVNHAFSNKFLIILFTYAYEMARNISGSDGGRIGAGGGEIPAIYKCAINALAANNNISDEFDKEFKHIFKKFIKPSLSKKIKKSKDKERYVRTILLQYASELAYYFKNTRHFLEDPIFKDGDKGISQKLHLSKEEFYQDFIAPQPFGNPETEKLFRTELSMDIRDFYHAAALIMIGNYQPSSIDKDLLTLTYMQMKAAVEEFWKARDIQWDGFFTSGNDSTDYHEESGTGIHI